MKALNIESTSAGVGTPHLAPIAQPLLVRQLSGDLSPLAGLTSLQSLDLSGCRQLSGDLSPLAGLTSLQSLNLAGCKQLRGNLSPLAGLTSLQSLNLYGCRQLSGGLSPLAGLTSLQSLDLTRCGSSAATYPRWQGSPRSNRSTCLVVSPSIYTSLRGTCSHPLRRQFTIESGLEFSASFKSVTKAVISLKYRPPARETPGFGRAN